MFWLWNSDIQILIGLTLIDAALIFAMIMNGGAGVERNFRA